MKRIVIILIVVAILAGGGWFAYQTVNPPQAIPLAQNPAIQFVSASRETLIDTVNATGKIKPQSEVDMNFEISGVVDEVLVKQGQYITAGTILARLDTSDLELQIQRAEIELSQREAELQQLFEDEPTEAEDIAATQADIETAKLKLVELQDDPDKQDQVTQAAADLSQKQVELQRAQWEYDQIAYRGDVGAMAQADALREATLAYETAQATYNIAVRDLTPRDSEIAEARATLLNQQAQLAALLAPPSAAEVATKQASVELAMIDLAEKRQELEQAVLIAPNDGVVLEVTIEPGERVLQDASEPAIIIADTAAYLLKVEIDEIDIGRLNRGQPATIVIDAFEEAEFAGQVTDIAPRPTSEEDALVTYEVTLALDSTRGHLGLLSGMSASAAIETRRLENVVVVPNRALKFETGSGRPINYVEMLDDNGDLKRLEVEVGLRDAQVTEIIAGVEEGDELMIRPDFEFGQGSS